MTETYLKNKSRFRSFQKQSSARNNQNPSLASTNELSGIPASSNKIKKEKTDKGSPKKRGFLKQIDSKLRKERKNTSFGLSKDL